MEVDIFTHGAVPFLGLMTTTIIPFSRRAHLRFPIEDQTLTIWPRNDLDLIYRLDK